eukprot:278101_1
MSLLKAAQHYGLARKKYKFEMRIHRLTLPSSNKKLLARILWSRRKKRTEKYKTSWVAGTREFIMNQVISHKGTMFLASNTNEIQSKHTTISIETKTGSEGSSKRKHTIKYCSFKIDLSDYIDTQQPTKVFHKHLKYKNHSGSKTAEIVFSIKSMQIQDDSCANRDDSVVSESDNASNLSMSSAPAPSIQSLRFDELKKKHVMKQRNQLLEQRNEEDRDYTIPTIVRHADGDEDDDEPPPFNMIHLHKSHNPRRKNSIAGSVISVCTTSSESDNEQLNVDEMDVNQLRRELKKRMDFDQMKDRLDKLKETIKYLQRDNARLEQKVASLQTVVEHKNNELFNSFSVFKYVSVSDAHQLRIDDYMDHRDETGHFLLAKIININSNKKKKKGKSYYIHYEGWDKKWDVWINVDKECNRKRIAPARSISRKSNTRFIDLQIGDNIDLNPLQRHKGWKCAIIKKLDKYSGQVQCQYVHQKEKYFYWAHLNDKTEIAPAMTKSCD